MHFECLELIAQRPHQLIVRYSFAYWSPRNITLHLTPKWSVRVNTEANYAKPALKHCWNLAMPCYGYYGNCWGLRAGWPKIDPKKKHSCGLPDDPDVSGQAASGSAKQQNCSLPLTVFPCRCLLDLYCLARVARAENIIYQKFNLICKGNQCLPPFERQGNSFASSWFEPRHADVCWSCKSMQKRAIPLWVPSFVDPEWKNMEKPFKPMQWKDCNVSLYHVQQSASSKILKHDQRDSHGFTSAVRSKLPLVKGAAFSSTQEIWAEFGWAFISSHKWWHHQNQARVRHKSWCPFPYTKHCTDWGCSSGSARNAPWFHARVNISPPLCTLLQSSFCISRVRHQVQVQHINHRIQVLLIVTQWFALMCNAQNANIRKWAIYEPLTQSSHRFSSILIDSRL